MSGDFLYSNIDVRSIAGLWLDHRMGIDEISCRVLGTSRYPLIVVIALQRFGCWDVLRMPTHRLIFRADFALSGRG